MHAVDLSILLQQIVNGITLGSMYGLIAVGYTMVYGIIGMINFAHGDVFMVSAYLTAIAIAVAAYFGITQVVLAIGFALVIAIVITGLYGWAIERVAYRPLRGSIRLAPLISAIGMSLILQEYVRLGQGARTQGIEGKIDGVLHIAMGTVQFQITYVQLLIIVVSVLSMSVLNLIISKTSLGRQCRATQQDPLMAQLLSVNTNRIIASVFVIGASMAAVAGVLFATYYGSFDYVIGFVIGIKAFTAAVLGGIGSLPGAILGGLLLGLCEGFFSAYVNTDYKDVFAFSVLVAVLIFRPSGLLGRPEVEKV